MKEEIRKQLLETGAVAVGFAKAGEIDEATHEYFKNWVGEGYNGEMGYLERHIPLRRHTDYVLPEANTVISLAFSYAPNEWRPLELPMISAYAYGEDYHKTLRRILKPVVRNFEEKYGGRWRICIDSAPVSERYWAVKSGIGYRGLNGCIIVDGCGPLCFLAEILTTLRFPPDESDEATLHSVMCSRCGKCVESCPTKALQPDGTFIATRCINYLMIEKKTPLTSSEQAIISTPPGYLLGCDRCLRPCPHNPR